VQAGDCLPLERAVEQGRGEDDVPERGEVSELVSSVVVVVIIVVVVVLAH